MCLPIYNIDNIIRWSERDKAGRRQRFATDRTDVVSYSYSRSSTSTSSTRFSVWHVLTVRCLWNPKHPYTLSSHARRIHYFFYLIILYASSNYYRRRLALVVYINILFCIHYIMYSMYVCLYVCVCICVFYAWGTIGGIDEVSLKTLQFPLSTFFLIPSTVIRLHI